MIIVFSRLAKEVQVNTPMRDLRLVSQLRDVKDECCVKPRVA